ncbi:uncharacterized protein LOC129891338 isoform X2 [Solanum dulcamara]|uniref:uncharacterized protein LOC129891338 isoform X2 n=1 Tax=Solanum dulcamara TaxID=45834 RepID=UPI002486B896|nr:uncharacterized protein LOC129891338 isoform X2 [Solanum dulcamara]
MTALAQISINLSPLNTPNDALYRKPNFLGLKLQRPSYCFTGLSSRKVSICSSWYKLGAFKEKTSFLTDKNGILMKEVRWGCEKRMVFVKFKQGFGFDGIGDGGGGGGGGRDNSETVRVLSNLVLAIGLTYLTMTGQLGWILDAIVSVWLLAVLLPILGLGAFIWWAGRDIVQSAVHPLVPTVMRNRFLKKIKADQMNCSLGPFLTTIKLLTAHVSFCVC